MTGVEAARQRFKPEQVRILFIGESAPAGGTFFYTMDSLLYDATQAAFRETVPDLLTEQNFLQSFRALGCWLVDLCDRTVNRLPDDEREAARDAGVDRLAATLKAEAPSAIVNVMLAIGPWVDTAIADAGIGVRARFDLPFPRRGQEWRYIDELASALRSLRSRGILLARR